MSEKPPLRGRVPVNRRIRSPHHPSPSAHRLHRKVLVSRLSNKPLKFIKRCNSEPTLCVSLGGGGGTWDEHRDMTPPGDSGVFFRHRNSTDVFSSSPELLPDSPKKIVGYNRDSKVVVQVTVEGSPGPIRAMVKLGSSVDETIRLVTNKYNAEGRSPRLDHDAMTSFELHHSYFSLERLDKSEMIGNIGSRSFYMRKSSVDKGDTCSNVSIDSEVVEARESNSPPPSLFIPFSDLITRKFNKIVKRSSKIWKILGCIGG